MNKKEFLRELENALEGRLTKSDIEEITADYSDIFDNGITNGKSEEEVAKEIGSPAKIARTILEDGSNHNGNREYTNFQKNINEKTSKIFDKVIEPDKNVRIESLASMSSRLGAYIIDCIVLGVVSTGIVLLFLAPLMFFSHSSIVEMSTQVVDVETSQAVGTEVVRTLENGFPRTLFFGNMIIFLLIFSGLNLFTTIFLWATNGYTPGKWLLSMRVVKLNGSKLSFVDALLREVVIKCIANAFLSGFLNLGSFIWACFTDDHKTVHDLVAKTRVITVNRKK